MKAPSTCELGYMEECSSGFKWFVSKQGGAPASGAEKSSCKEPGAPVAMLSPQAQTPLSMVATIL